MGRLALVLLILPALQLRYTRLLFRAHGVGGIHLYHYYASAYTHIHHGFSCKDFRWSGGERAVQAYF